ncbi:MAG: carboxypeptidase M32 [Chloroflexota bacterium]|nr:carboxypeptidase M32 [Chloroflexota bacterium]
MSTKLEQLKERLAQVCDLTAAAAIMEWDQQVNMPPGGSEARAQHLATVKTLAHSLFIAGETGQLLQDTAAEVAGLPYESDETSLVRVTQREYDKLRRVPESLVAERARASALAFDAWVQARAESNFAHFRPHLERVVDLSVKYAEALGYEDCLYDALLDRYEPDMKTAQVAAVFQRVKSDLVPLIQAIIERGRPVDDAIFDQEYPRQAQWDFGLLVLRDMGFDFEHGRQDHSAHPFTTAFSPQDVRVTTRILPDHLQSGLFGTVHEGGHALYEQGMRIEIDRTPLLGGASYATHESQSRLWENIIARNHNFWTYYFPKLREFFPQQLEGVDLTTFYRAINKVEPSFIRVEADEVTYNLHIFLRFELEQDLLEGRLAVADLPQAWNAKIEEYLGITPPDDAHGVLQDIHWAEGYFGYFPTYALGNLLAVQFYRQALEEMPDLPEQITRGQFGALLAWLRDNIHTHGKKLTPTELVRRVTGEEMDAAPFLAYLREKYTEIYGLGFD